MKQVIDFKIVSETRLWKLWILQCVSYNDEGPMNAIDVLHIWRVPKKIH